MKSMKIMLTFLSFFLVIGITSAQKAAKIDKKVAKKVMKLDQRLSAIDNTLALTTEQKTQISEIYKNGMLKLKAIPKDTKNRKKQTRPIRKAMNKKVKKEVLTKDQRAALKKAKKENKAARKEKKKKNKV